MTDNSTNKSETGAGSGSALIDVDSPDEEVDFPEEPTDLEEPAEVNDEALVGGGVRGSGAVSGGFGLAGLVLAVVSLTTNSTSGVVVSHDQYSQEISAPSSGLTPQQQLNLAVSGWHTEGWWALAFAAAAVLFGAGALLLPWIRVSRGTPGWARATAVSAIIVGLIGVGIASACSPSWGTGRGGPVRRLWLSFAPSTTFTQAIKGFEAKRNPAADIP